VDDDDDDDDDDAVVVRCSVVFVLSIALTTYKNYILCVCLSSGLGLSAVCLYSFRFIHAYPGSVNSLLLPLLSVRIAYAAAALSVCLLPMSAFN